MEAKHTSGDTGTFPKPTEADHSKASEKNYGPHPDREGKRDLSREIEYCPNSSCGPYQSPTHLSLLSFGSQYFVAFCMLLLGQSYLSCHRCESLRSSLLIHNPEIICRFSFVWLMVMVLYPLAALLLKFSRGRLPRKPHTSLSLVFFTFLVAFAAIGGNVAINPLIVG